MLVSIMVDAEFLKYVLLFIKIEACFKQAQAVIDAAYKSWHIESWRHASLHAFLICVNAPMSLAGALSFLPSNIRPNISYPPYRFSLQAE